MENKPKKDSKQYEIPQQRVDSSDINRTKWQGLQAKRDRLSRIRQNNRKK